MVRVLMTASLMAATAGLAYGQCESTLLLAPDRLTNDHLGMSMSAKNGWLAVGAPHDDNARGVNGGSVYMWKKNPAGDWQYYSRFQCVDNGPLQYGMSVATDGTTLAVVTDTGVYLSERHADGFWYPAGQLPATPNSPNGRAYGKVVAINGDRIALGDWTYDYQGKTDVGAVHMYRKSGGVWQYHLLISNPTAASSSDDRFGTSVAIADNGAVVVGAPGYDWPVNNTVWQANGAAFLFVPSSGSYALPQGGVVSTGNGDNLRVGTSVAISGNWIAVGTPHAWGTGADSAGSVTVFKRLPNNSLDYWARGEAYPAVENEQIGTAVAIEGDRVVASGYNNSRTLEFQITADPSLFVLDRARDISGNYGAGGFGRALAYEGDDLFISNHVLTDGGASGCGGVFLWKDSGRTPADEFEFAPAISLPAHIEGCTTMATANVNFGSNICGQSRTSPDVWVKFTATETRRVMINLSGDYDTVVSVHLQEPRTWDSMAIACNDDLASGIRDSRLALDVTAGTTYYVRCTGYNGRVGNFTLDINPSCPADFNEDGFLDFFDYDDFVTCFENGACPASKTADFNGDQFVDFFDYDDFVTAFEQGC